MERYPDGDRIGDPHRRGGRRDRATSRCRHGRASRGPTPARPQGVDSVRQGTGGDPGAGRRCGGALRRDKSLLAPGIREVRGTFHVDDAVEIVDPEGSMFAKGITRVDAEDLAAADARGVVVHKDDLILLDPP
ncbi:MAG: PUA domain-containing protein [Microthrixaceae bacterium]